MQNDVMIPPWMWAQREAEFRVSQWRRLTEVDPWERMPAEQLEAIAAVGLDVNWVATTCLMWVLLGWMP